MKHAARVFLWPILFGAAFLGAWEVYVRVSGVSALVLPSPLAVGDFARNHAGVLLSAAATTLGSILAGFALGSLLGLGIGVAMHLMRWFREGAYPWLVASQMVPVAAIAPILVLWFGFTLAPKVIVVALICFFPVAVNTADGLRSVDPEMVRMLRSMGAGRLTMLRLLGLPAALPSVFSGLRVAVALSMVAAVFGEWIGSSGGLGYLMLVYNSRLVTAGLFAAVAVLAVLGISLYFLLVIIELWMIPWRRIPVDPRQANAR